MPISDADNKPADAIVDLPIREADLAGQIAWQAAAHSNEVLSPAAFERAKAAAESYLNTVLAKYNLLK